MKNVAILFFAFLSVFSSAAVAAEHVDGFVTLSTGRTVYVKADFIHRSLPTLVLLNGLTYDVNNWSQLVKELPQGKLNIVRYDMVGQGKSMAQQAPYANPIGYVDQVDDLEALLSELKIDKATTVGLSYGGAIGVEHAERYPNRIEQTVLMAPYVAPLMTQDNMIRAQIASTRLMFPFNPSTDDELYDFFLKQHVYGTYPVAEPVVLSHFWKLDSVYRMVQGIRKLIVADNVESLNVPTHMMIAEFDQYVESGTHVGLWKAIPKHVRASRVTIGMSEHKIPEARPQIAARWIMEIIKKNEKLNDGREFFANSFKNIATAKDGTVIPLH